jgi:hypothetical protein
MDDVDEEFLHSGIQDKAIYLEFKAIVQPFIDKANAEPWGDHSRLQAEMRAAMMPFLKKYNPELK